MHSVPTQLLKKTVSTVKNDLLRRTSPRFTRTKRSTGDTNDQKAEGSPCFLLYQTFPGIGALTAALLLGELGDITRFKTHKQLNAFVGIDIRRYQSGKYTGQDRINKRGNPKARKIIFFTIRNMIRQQRAAPNHIVDYYYKLKKQPIPKKDKVATVACMNKLLKCMHAMVRAHTEYDYAYAVSVDH
mgnify:CR=1 FL=1